MNKWVCKMGLFLVLPLLVLTGCGASKEMPPITHNETL